MERGPGRDRSSRQLSLLVTVNNKTNKQKGYYFIISFADRKTFLYLTLKCQWMTPCQTQPRNCFDSEKVSELNVSWKALQPHLLLFDGLLDCGLLRAVDLILLREASDGGPGTFVSLSQQNHSCLLQQESKQSSAEGKNRNNICLIKFSVESPCQRYQLIFISIRIREKIVGVLTYFQLNDHRSKSRTKHL